MIRTIRIFPPLLALFALAVGSLLASPAPTRAAEPDAVARALYAAAPASAFVGRSPAGLGYVLVTINTAFLVVPAPHGRVSVQAARPATVIDLARRFGWRV